MFNRDSDIWMVGSDGSNPHAITSGASFDSYPVFSPDASKIVFARNGVLMVMSSTPPYTPTAIPGSSGNETSPDFLPDGSGLVYQDSTSGYREKFTRLDGSGRHDLTTPTGGAQDREGSFSPDGQFLGFERLAGPVAGGAPRTSIVPSVGSSKPTARLSNVDLPAPFGPTSPTTRPAGMLNEQSVSAQRRR